MMGENRFFGPREYTAYHSQFNPLQRNHGGSALLIRNDIAHSLLPLNTPLEAIAVQVNISRVYTICSLYLSPNKEFSVRDLTNLYNQLPHPFLILGDLNGRHESWGDVITSAKGVKLQSFIEQMDLTVLNDGNPTHFHIQTGSFSCIDLSIASPNAFIDFEWNVLDDLYGSDHFPIIISSGDSVPISRAPRWCIERANWPLFKELSHIEADASDLPTVDEAVYFLSNILLNAGFQSIPRTTGQFHRKPVPWWNMQCTIRRKAMRAAFTRYRRHKCMHYLICFKKARASFRWQIKYSRRECWILFLSRITWKTPMTLVWAKIKKIVGKFKPSPPPVLKMNGNLISDPKAVSDIFAGHFAKVSSRNPESPYHQMRMREESFFLDFTARTSESYNMPFTMKEFLFALSKSKNSAPGADDILYDMIKNSSYNTKVFILSILNRIFKASEFPSMWEIALILPFLKPGKDSSIPSSYRPIALTSCLCKLMEKMVNARLVWFLERKGVISSAQCGFRPAPMSYFV